MTKEKEMVEKVSGWYALIGISVIGLACWKLIEMAVSCWNYYCFS